MSLKISKTTSNILKIAGWIVVIILVILMGKVYFWEKQYYANKTKEPRSTAPAVITEIASAINPSEIKPSKEDVEAHQVAADEGAGMGRSADGQGLRHSAGERAFKRFRHGVRWSAPGPGT